MSVLGANQHLQITHSKKALPRQKKKVKKKPFKTKNVILNWSVLAANGWPDAPANSFNTDILNLDIIDAGVAVATPDLFVAIIDKALSRKLNEGKLYMSIGGISACSWGVTLSNFFELINHNFIQNHESNFA